jgi:hypothetical protein
LHDRHRKPSASQTCFPYPTRPFGPASPASLSFAGEGEPADRTQPIEKHRELDLRETPTRGAGALALFPLSSQSPVFRIPLDSGWGPMKFWYPDMRITAGLGKAAGADARRRLDWLFS